MQEFKIFDKLENRFITEDDNMPIVVAMRKDVAYLGYDVNRYAVINEINLCDSKGKLLKINDIIHIDGEYDGLYLIKEDANNIVFDSLDKGQTVDLIEIEHNNIVYVSSIEFMNTNNLKYICINCDNCLDEIKEFVSIDQHFILCKGCNSMVNI